MGGFLSGLTGAIQTVGPIAANIGGDYAQAQAQGSQLRNQQALQMIMLARQQRQAEIENALNVSKTGEQNALAAQHRQEMDPNFAGQKAGAIAAAQWPEKEAELRAQLDNNLQLERARGATEQQITAQRIAGEQGIESLRIQNAMQLQQNQQGFTATQNDLNRTATAENQAKAQQAHAATITQQQSGQALPILESWVNRGPLAHPTQAPTSPSSSPATAPNPQQSAWDNAAQHLQKTQPNIDPSTVLGTRP